MIIMTSYAKTSREAHYLPADTPAAALKVVLPRQAGHEYDVDHYRGSSTSPPTAGEELPRRDGAGRESIRSELEALHRPTTPR
jgi:hypothetical protein